VDVIAAPQRWGDRSGGHCQLRTDAANTYYCERAHVFAPHPLVAANRIASIEFDPPAQTTTGYRVTPGRNIFLPELPDDLQERLSR
jgi:hypothetical protein